MSELISVIIPVYNTSAFLVNCLDSVQKQTYTNLDVIIVDDASTDESLAICRRFAENDSRFRVLVAPQNQGQAAARNLAIDNAKGRYLTFLDSDDWLNSDTIEKLYQALLSDEAAIAMSHFYRFKHGHGVYELYEPQFASGLMTYRAFLDQAMAGLSLYIAPWGKLFKRDLFEVPTRIRFPEGKISEDIYILHRLFARANRITYLSEALYCWLNRSDSNTTSAMSEKKARDYMNGLRERLLDVLLMDTHLSEGLVNYQSNMGHTLEQLEAAGLTDTTFYRELCYQKHLCQRPQEDN